MRLPKVSSSTAIVDPVTFVGSIVNFTPSFFNLSNSP